MLELSALERLARNALPPASTMLIDLADLAPDANTFDVVVIHADRAGMSAARFAAIEGASVLIVERTAHVGGTTAGRHANQRAKGARTCPSTHVPADASRRSA